MTKNKSWPSFANSNSSTNDNNNHMIVVDGTEYAGRHLILDIWEAKNLNNLKLIEQCFHQCIAAANATLLNIHLHHFEQGDGVSGVAILAESHISIHTWPEKNYAAFDVFMCGDTAPHKVIPIIVDTFDAQKHKLREILRGEVAR